MTSASSRSDTPRQPLARHVAAQEEPRTPEEQLAVDLRIQRWRLIDRVERLCARTEPHDAVLIESEGRGLLVHDRGRLVWCTEPGVGNRFTLAEALALQAEFPLYLADTKIRSLYVHQAS